MSTYQIRIIRCFDLNHVMIAFFPIQSFFGVNISIGFIHTKPFFNIAVNNVIENTAIFAFVWIVSLNFANEITWFFFFGNSKSKFEGEKKVR